MMRRSPIYLSIYFTGKRNNSVMVWGTVGLMDHANEHVSDSTMMNASFVYPENTPTTKEVYYYRMLPGQRYQEVLVWRAALLKPSNGMQPGPKTLICLAVLLSLYMMLRMKILRKLLPQSIPSQMGGSTCIGRGQATPTPFSSAHITP